MTATPRSVELRSLAQSLADALPTTVEEVVLTGSVSRGVADDVSDIEMLVVTAGELELEECFSLAAACGLAGPRNVGPAGGADALAPDGPNIVRAREWLGDGLVILGLPPAAPDG